MARLCGPECIKTIDFVFFAEREIRAAVMDARDKPSGPKGGAGGNAFTSDPTANNAIRNVISLRSVYLSSSGRTLKHPEEWLQVIERTYSACDTTKKEVARRHYMGEHYSKTCRELPITQSTYSYLLNDVRQFAVMCAIQKGLIRVF